MSTEPADEGGQQLDFLSFVDYAIDRVDQQAEGIDTTAMRLVLTLHRVTSSLVYDLEASVHRPRGWSWPGFRVLFVLWLTGPLEAKKIAELTGMSRAAVSALVNTLDRDGLASRTRAAHDRRAVRIELTEAGRTAITQAFSEHNRREQAWANMLSEPERTILIGLLQKLALGASEAAQKRRN